MDNIYDYDTEESEDTISLCDFSIKTNTIAAADHEDQEYYSASASASDQEHYFEFCSSEEWSTTTTSFPPENIIFCGKIIPYREPTSQIGFQNLASIDNNETGFKKPVESFRWNGSHNISSKRKEEPKLRKINSSVGKLRWSMFLFGGRRFLPREMALRDIKSRQSRSRGSSSSTLFGLERDDDKKKTTTRSPPQGLLGLLKALGCGGQRHANSVVKASIGCIPRL